MSVDSYLLTLPNDGTRGYRVEIDEFVEDNGMTNLFLIALSNVQKDSLKAVKDGQKKKIYRTGSIFMLRPQFMDCQLRIGMAFKVLDLKATGIATMNWIPSQSGTGHVWPSTSNSRKKDFYVELPKPTGNAEGGFDTIPILYTPSLFLPMHRKEAGQNFGRGVLRIKSGERNVRTVRVPSKDAPDATNDRILNLAIQCQAGANAILLIQMLNSDHTAAPFSSGSRAPKVFVNEVRSCSAFENHSGRGKTTIEGKTYPTVSVESFHDGIHNLLGTGGGSFDEDPQNNHKLGGVSGHMGNPQVAADDPIFWLHHNNVERLLCLHQAIYPDKYLDDGAPSNNLAPFLHDNGGGALWKSTNKWIKNYWNSGFAVPGAMQPQGDFKDIKAELTKYLVETYLWATNNTPHNLKTWLSNLNGSWALFGSSAAPVSTSAIHVSAITT